MLNEIYHKLDVYFASYVPTISNEPDNKRKILQIAD